MQSINDVMKEYLKGWHECKHCGCGAREEYFVEDNVCEDCTRERSITHE